MKKILTIAFAAWLCTGAFAQRSELYAATDRPLEEGISLYQSGHYAASQRILSHYTEDHPSVSQRETDEAAFYYAADAFELRQRQAQKLLSRYAKEHTYSPYLSEVHYMQGVLWAERRKFKQALKELDQVQSKDLFRQHVDGCLFYKGYAHLHMNEPNAALGFFQRLHSKEESPYYLQSRYYYAYSQYALGQYNKALPDFLFCEQTNEYKAIAPYYIIQIYYHQGKYEEVEGRAREMLTADPENVNNWELYRILGEITYQKGNFTEAIDYLDRYATAAEKQNAGLVREDLYLLGMSCYQTADYERAIGYLRKVKSATDSLTQSTQFHLGNAIMRTMTPQTKATSLEQAKACYSAAMRMDFSTTLKEEAMYNYCLTAYQSSSALGESVSAFTDFLNAYPNSRHKEDVYGLLSDAFMSSKNYAAALDALSKITNPDTRMLVTMQYLRYQMGADYFLQSRHTDAVMSFDDVLDHASDGRIATDKDNRKYKTESLFMRAESEYRLQNYTEAQKSINEFQLQSNASSSENYELARYLEGYIYFQQKNYKQSLNAFKDFVASADKSQATYPDALNRIGDCYFTQRDFVQAESYYSKVVALGASGADYAMFQRGYALGLLKRYGDKVTVLERLVTQYPKSDYSDDALYEIARAEVQRADNRSAIAAYDRLLSTYPNSNLARKAALEKAMLYYNEKRYNEAIEAYKVVVRNYPSTDEAYSALEGMEMCYVETNNVAEYLAYTKTLGKINMQTNSTKEDSLTYTAAELQYMQGNYQQAAKGFTTYLNNFCDGGRYCTSAQYYCADAYYQMGDKQNALREFRRLTELSSNLYMEEALMRTAELYFDAADYRNSLTYFRRLQQKASTSKNTNIARLGVLRSSYFLGDNESTISVASELIAESTTDAETLDEARYNRGKAYFQKGLYEKAIADFRQLAGEVRTAQGAESKYLICEALYRQGDYDKAEKEVMQFANMNTSQQYWLAKAFILLSDIYVHRGDDFMAEQYLLSLQNNYTAQDDIQTTIGERLELIRSRSAEKQEVQQYDEEIDDEY